jgi:hypothetical protein
MVVPIDTQEFRTDDMALTTWLRMCGHTPQTIRWEGDQCYWIFYCNDSLLYLFDQFQKGESSVEVRAYNRAFASTKREFYDSRPR